MSSSSSVTIELINTGIVMGIVHVLTGPDHLSALATLSGTNISSRQCMDAFLLGIKWGVGHSVGLLVVGGALIALEETSSEWVQMNDAVSTVLEGFVGVFMLALGSYGLYRAQQNRRMYSPLSNSLKALRSKSTTRRSGGDKVRPLQPSPVGGPIGGGGGGGGGGLPTPPHPRDMRPIMEMPPDLHRRDSDINIVCEMSSVLNRDGDSMRSGQGIPGMGDDDEDDIEQRIFNAVESLRQGSDAGEGGGDDDDDDADDRYMNTFRSSARGALSRSFVNILHSKPPPMKATSMVQKHAAPENSIVEKGPSEMVSRSRFGRACFMCTPSLLALMAGLIHGVAGPGGVLGVIPAVQLRDPRKATVYLSTFCLTSTLVMGMFAGFYGKFSEWLAGQLGPGGGRRGCERVFFVEVGSAFLSIAVGLIWLVLLAVGQLDYVLS